MAIALYFAAVLIVAVAAAHSYLGERYILICLFRRRDLPELFGSTEFTTRTLRFAWHLSSVAWLGFAGLVVLMAHSPTGLDAVGFVIGCTFLAHSAIALAASRGRHLSWPVFLVIGIIVIYASRS